MTEICQSSLPIAPWMDERMSRLPGIQPLDPGDWLRVDDAFAGQMAYRDHLIAQNPHSVIAMDAAARPAADELLARVLAEVATIDGYRVTAETVIRPDGKSVTIDRTEPLRTLGRLAQCDFVIMQDRGSEHAITGAVLCFPASWSLDEKFNRGLIRVHGPVDDYDQETARRVQRLFDAIRPEQPLWRANWLMYADPDLHQPRRENARRERPRREGDQRLWMRVERQCLVRLPQTGAVVFSIHTYVVRFEDLTPRQRDTIPDAKAERVGI